MILFKEEEEGCLQDTVKMKQIRLFHGHVLLSIPEKMEEMEEPEKSIYYPYREKPEYIWKNAGGDVQMTFQQLPKSLSKEQVYDAAIAAAHLMKKNDPGRKVGRVHCFIGEKVIGWFIMDLHGGKKKHVKFIMEADGCFTMGTMTYPVADQEKWAVVMECIYSSIGGEKKL